MTQASKKQAKKRQQKDWGMKVSEDIPMVLVREVNDEIGAVLESIAGGVGAVGVQVVVIEPTREELRKLCRDLEVAFPGWFKVVSGFGLDETSFDMELLEEATVAQLRVLKEKKIVPVAGKGVTPFDPVAEKGNGFAFNLSDPWSLYVALVRATETYKFPYDWGNMVKG